MLKFFVCIKEETFSFEFLRQLSNLRNTLRNDFTICTNLVNCKTFLLLQYNKVVLQKFSLMSIIMNRKVLIYSIIYEITQFLSS